MRVQVVITYRHKAHHITHSSPLNAFLTCRHGKNDVMTKDINHTKYIYSYAYGVVNSKGSSCKIRSASSNFFIFFQLKAGTFNINFPIMLDLSTNFIDLCGCYMVK